MLGCYLVSAKKLPNEIVTPEIVPNKMNSKRTSSVGALDLLQASSENIRNNFLNPSTFALTVHNAELFLINARSDVELCSSIKNSMWTFMGRDCPALDSTLKSGPVYLAFMINNSYFVGIAQLISRYNTQQYNVRWLYVKQLAFQKTFSITGYKAYIHMLPIPRNLVGKFLRNFHESGFKDCGSEEQQNFNRYPTTSPRNSKFSRTNSHSNLSQSRMTDFSDEGSLIIREFITSTVNSGASYTPYSSASGFDEKVSRLFIIKVGHTDLQRIRSKLTFSYWPYENTLDIRYLQCKLYFCFHDTTQNKYCGLALVDSSSKNVLSGSKSVNLTLRWLSSKEVKLRTSLLLSPIGRNIDRVCHQTDVDQLLRQWDDDKFPVHIGPTSSTVSNTCIEKSRGLQATRFSIRKDEPKNYTGSTNAASSVEKARLHQQSQMKLHQEVQQKREQEKTIKRIRFEDINNQSRKEPLLQNLANLGHERVSKEIRSTQNRDEEEKRQNMKYRKRKLTNEELERNQEEENIKRHVDEIRKIDRLFKESKRRVDEYKIQKQEEEKRTQGDEDERQWMASERLKRTAEDERLKENSRKHEEETHRLEEERHKYKEEFRQKQEKEKLIIMEKCQQQKQEEERLRHEEERRRDIEKRRRQEENRRRQEEDRRIEEEQCRQKEEKEKLRIMEESQQQKQEEERRRDEEGKRRQEEERRRQEVERRRDKEERRKQEEQKCRHEKEKCIQEEEKRIDKEEISRQEEERYRLEEQRRRQEEEFKQNHEKEELRLHEECQQRKQEEEKRMHEEDRRRQEEQFNKKQEKDELRKHKEYQQQLEEEERLRQEEKDVRQKNEKEEVKKHKEYQRLEQEKERFISNQKYVKEEPHCHQVKQNAGLMNAGSTCYMNSVLQCLSKASWNGFEYDHHSNDPLLTEFFLMMEDITKSTEALDTTGFRITLSQFSERFGSSNYRQQDAHEFLTFLLDRLTDQLQSSMVYKSVMPSYSDNFIGKLQNRAMFHCGHRVSTTQIFYTISLPVNISKELSVEHCLQSFLHEEDMAEQAYCNECRNLVDCSLKLSFETLPRILILHLKKFDFFRIEKLNVDVQFPFKGLKVADSSGESYVYDLYGICNHFGSLTAGHYKADVKTSDSGTWYNYDDSSVQRTSEDELRRNSRSAYLLFYKRN